MMSRAKQIGEGVAIGALLWCLGLFLGVLL